MDQGLILAVDVGTQSVRAVVLRADGSVLLQQRKLSKPYYSKEPGYAEVPAGQFLADTFRVLRDTMEALGEQREDLAALTLTCNRDAILPVDKNDRPLRDWIIWADQRRTPEAMDRVKRQLGFLGPLLRVFGKDFLEFLITRSKFNWLYHREPEVYAATERFYTISSRLTHALTGDFVDAVGMQVGVLPFEAARLDWYKLPQIYTMLGVSRDKLPDLFHPGEQMGTITAEAAAQTGLPEGLPVLAAGGDKQCETLGCGCFDAKQAVISYGTMATVSTGTGKHYGDKKFRFHTFAATRKNYWNLEFQIYRGYWLVTWFCRQYAKEGDVPAFLSEMNRRAEKLPAGANGIFVFPFWAPHPGLYPEAKGAIVGITDTHRPEDVYRGILESIAFGLKQGLDMMQKRSRHKVEKIYVTGGGSRSKAAMQITADIFNVPCIRKGHPEVGAAGAAIAAAVALGMYDTYEAAIAAFSRDEEVVNPNPANVKVYREIYDKYYLKFYRRNLKLFRKLDELQNS